MLKIISVLKSKSINNNTTYKSSKFRNVKKYRGKSIIWLLNYFFQSVRLFLTSIECMFQEKRATFVLQKIIILNHFNKYQYITQ